jgi:hypothetical protein
MFSDGVFINTGLPVLHDQVEESRLNGFSDRVPVIPA